ncbi:DNA-directed RNA polymerase subunit omega [Candidatus Phytoplasma gossypii]|uniref:DNA-directed RNA polymerase subunit omega n=1 Tax=Candidatus Phytoplasma gossypii TaxID=2982629 RepID=A0ABT9D4G0_9MOLU|nr:DNA-directed RNA polymerase subunit omega ['Gossypium sp.' phytoplasma]MDO8057564.1 DNA-directed RNA polymerase subunit omega ['Gossypium sp.' phytoplasma]
MIFNQKKGFSTDSIDDLLKCIDSKYKLAYVAGKIAHVIETKDEFYKSKIKGKKIVSKALSEIINKNFRIIFKEN